MPKHLVKTKNIIVFMLLLTFFPLVFVEGFLAYLYHSSDEEGLRLFNQTYDIFYKICINSAYISLILTYIISHYIIKIKKLKLWSKLSLIFLTYFVLFLILIFVIVFGLGGFYKLTLCHQTLNR